MGLQAFGPSLERRGLGRQWTLAIQALQIFKEHPPGHAVHHQVMHHQQQALGAVGQLGEHGAQ